MNAVKVANDVLAFFIELAAVAAVAVWGFGLDASSLRIVVGIAAPVLFILIWARWLAPKSGHRLQLPWLLVAKIVLFGLATVALFAADHPVPATVLGVLAAVNLALATAWRRV